MHWGDPEETVKKKMKAKGNLRIECNFECISEKTQLSAKGWRPNGLKVSEHKLFPNQRLKTTIYRHRCNPCEARLKIYINKDF